MDFVNSYLLKQLALGSLVWVTNSYLVEFWKHESPSQSSNWRPKQAGQRAESSSVQSTWESPGFIAYNIYSDLGGRKKHPFYAAFELECKFSFFGCISNVSKRNYWAQCIKFTYYVIILWFLALNVLHGIVGITPVEFVCFPTKSENRPILLPLACLLFSPRHWCQTDVYPSLPLPRPLKLPLVADIKIIGVFVFSFRGR